MDCWGFRECVCAVEMFIGTGSIIKIQHRFYCEMNRQEAPAPNAFCRWVRQMCEEKGSVTWKKPPGWFSSVCTPENITVLLWRWRWASHHSHVAMLHRDYQWISSHKASTKPQLVVSTKFFMPHTAMISRAVLCCLFLQRVLSHSAMCYGSLFAGPNSTWLFLWGYLKSKVYSRCPVD
jgi:hypothetical protein